jgi:hypothetical protein
MKSFVNSLKILTQSMDKQSSNVGKNGSKRYSSGFLLWWMSIMSATQTINTVLCIHKLWTCWQIEHIEIFPFHSVQRLILFIISICPNSGFSFPIFSSSVATIIWRHTKAKIHNRRWGRELHSCTRWLTFIRAGVTGGSGIYFQMVY